MNAGPPMTTDRDSEAALNDSLMFRLTDYTRRLSHGDRDAIAEIIRGQSVQIATLSRQLAEAQQRSDYQYLKTTMQHEIEKLKLELTEAQGVIERMRKAADGKVLLPINPTDEILEAMADAYGACDKEGRDNWLHVQPMYSAAVAHAAAMRAEEKP